MAEIAIGWLGWTEDQALAADVNAIQSGFFGRVSMLKACFGASEAPNNISSRPLSPQLMDALF